MTGEPTDAAAATPPLPARRRTSMVRCYAAPWLALWTRVFPSADGKPSLTLIAKATFDIDVGGRARRQPERPAPSGDVYLHDDPAASLLYPSDFAPFKRRADVVLRGHACAVGGGAREMEVALSFGSRKGGFARTMAVCGPRSWERDGRSLRPGKPRRFDRVALLYEHAFGGPGLAVNPVGIGAGQAVEGDPLPQLEDPRQRLARPGQLVAPMGFGAIAPHWRSAASSGSYDDAWLKTRWPFLPADFDDSAFQCAPAVQQLDALRGDERFSLRGMHPEHHELEGQLPGLRVRGFVQRAAAAGGAFEEVPLALDTVIIDADALTLTLLWRGAARAADVLARDVLEAFALAEALDAPPLSAEQAAVRFAAHKTPLPPVTPEPGEPAATAANDGDAINDVDGRIEEDDGPAGETAPPPRNAAHAALDAEARRVERQLKAALSSERMHTSLREAGLPEALLDQLTAAEPSGAELPSTPQRPGATLGADALEQLLTRMDGKLPADAIAELRRELRGLADDAASLQAAVRPPAAGVPQDGAGRDGAAGASAAGDGAAGDGGPDDVRAEVEARRARGASLDGLRLDGADLSGLDLSGVDLSRRSLIGTRLSGARLFEARLKEAVLTGGRLDGAQLQGAQLGGADLRDAQLDHANLDGADLSGALLDGATLRGASVTRTSFRGSQARHACFDGLRGARADFSDALLDDSSLAGAQLPHANFSATALARADLRGAKLPHVRLYDAAAEQATLDGADLTGARADDVGLARASLREVVAPNSVWEGAQLQRSVWQGAKLRGASLVRADAEDATLAAVDLRGGRLGEAALRGAVLRGADLMQAALEHADLRGADLSGANLHAVASWNAELSGARLQGAIVTQSRLAAGRGGRGTT